MHHFGTASKFEVLMPTKEIKMEQACFALPVITGRTENARRFMRELDGPRKAEFDASERRIGITKEAWFLQHTAQGDLLIGYIESADFSQALRLFAESRDSFDLWFKQRMAEVTGVDLNNPPQGPLSEQLSSYSS
jgi:hypothetical protein